jgi:hypothetical protein
MAKTFVAKEGTNGQNTQVRKTVASTFTQSLHEQESKGPVAEPTSPYIRFGHRRTFISHRMQ